METDRRRSLEAYSRTRAEYSLTLSALLKELFLTVREVRHWVRQADPDILDVLPDVGGTVTMEDYCEVAADALVKRGYTGEVLRAHLVAVRPLRQDDIVLFMAEVEAKLTASRERVPGPAPGGGVTANAPTISLRAAREVRLDQSIEESPHRALLSLLRIDAPSVRIDSIERGSTILVLSVEPAELPALDAALERIGDFATTRLHVAPRKAEVVYSAVSSIQDTCQVNIDLNGFDAVDIASFSLENTERAIRMIREITQEAEIGALYVGVVKRVVDFGAFVEIFPGTDGLVHISHLTHERVEKVEDVLAEGDEVLVRVIDVDRSGKIRLSRKEASSTTESPRG